MWLLELILAYGLGSVSGGLLLGRFRGRDIRDSGSGSTGGTNALRVLGWRLAFWVVLIDIIKGVLAAALVPCLGGPSGMPLWCGLAAVAGHVWPVWHGFRGGKGAATAAGVLAVVLPLSLLPLLAVWLLTVGLSGYVGLATTLAAAALVPVTALLAPEAHLNHYLAFSAALTALVVFAHRGNLKRLYQGRENRFERARVLRRHGGDR